MILVGGRKAALQLRGDLGTKKGGVVLEKSRVPMSRELRSSLAARIAEIYIVQSKTILVSA